MNSISIPSRKTLQVFSGRAYPELAEEIAKYLDVTLTPQSAYEFANGEIFVRFNESVRGADAFVIQSCGAPINTWVMETLIMIDALKRASADRITVVQHKKNKTPHAKKQNPPRASGGGGGRGLRCFFIYATSSCHFAPGSTDAA